MIPGSGPVETGSRGERHVYQLLKEQLDDDFVIIHSLPWLNEAVRNIGQGREWPSTGEIDFLVLHADLGILALEVKGGIHHLQNGEFVYLQTGKPTYAVSQSRRNTHGLARWLGDDPSLRFRIGYGLVFPHSDFEYADLPPALTANNDGRSSSLLISKPDLDSIGQAVIRLMGFWKGGCAAPVLGARMDALVARLCPGYDGAPSWASRVLWDGKVWLRLTPEQSRVIDVVEKRKRTVVKGWPGTGKTVVLIESARRAALQEKRVLVLVFNALLSRYIAGELNNAPQVQVATWYGFCAGATPASKVSTSKAEKDQWLASGAFEDVQTAASRGALAAFDVILIDEAQSFAREWIEWLCSWHKGALLAFCDFSQVFSFERDRVTQQQLCQAVGDPSPFQMTIALRSPREVYERLQLAVPPDVQLSLPRDAESHGLRELVEAPATDALQRIVAEYVAGGLQREDIVVLVKTDEDGKCLQNASYRTEILSRFRGMEAPVVIVMWADAMSDAELFCAYSRATTACTAIYDAENVGARGVRGAFEPAFLGVPALSDAIRSARKRAASAEIIGRDDEVTWQPTKTIRLAHIPRWQGWGLELQGAMAQAWWKVLDEWRVAPLYVWKISTLRTVQLSVAPERDDGRRIPWMGRELIHCSTCKGITPHLRSLRQDSSIIDHCSPCCGFDVFPSNAAEAFLERILRVDALLARESKKLTAAERKDVPWRLAVAAIYQALQADHPHRLPVEIPSAGGLPMYQCALTLILALVAKLGPNALIETDHVAEKYFGRYQQPVDLTLHSWKAHMAAAGNVACQRGFLVKQPGASKTYKVAAEDVLRRLAGSP
ncbi:nuclease-related domain-containing DEAD/DEAH box helicase [Stenotrophomonas maltophilia]|uniref:nuclease-related domain-containing DEAD/DEAH box helicase n=1 Tax=Stenotrophomonas maltophilia TaxID=40324 RepID=UPI00223938F7|nr:NERD domain-containing protein [Stenotrophomonas maltophilia]